MASLLAHEVRIDRIMEQNEEKNSKLKMHLVEMGRHPHLEEEEEAVIMDMNEVVKEDTVEVRSSILIANNIGIYKLIVGIMINKLILLQRQKNVKKIKCLDCS